MCVYNEYICCIISSCTIDGIAKLCWSKSERSDRTWRGKSRQVSKKSNICYERKMEKKIIWIILAEPSSKIFFWVTYLLLSRTSLRYSACLPTSWTLPNRKRIKLVWIDFYASMTAARPQRYIHLPFINSDRYAIISLRNSMLHHGM